MIQRIQTLFLFLAGAATLGVFGLPFARTAEPTVGIFQDAQFNPYDHVGLMVTFGLAGLLALISILLFNNRKLQLRLTLGSLLVLLGGIIFGGVLFAQSSEAGSSATPGSGLFIMPAAIILLLLAYRFISKDEKLVRSMDRLR